MVNKSLSIAALLLIGARIMAAQSIPTTVAAAEAEGAAFPHGTTPDTVSSAFSTPVGGTTERRCVSAADYRAPGGLRSGEFIIRGGLGMQANRGDKILWLPWHNPFEFRDTLVVRAVRLESPSDTVRITRSGSAWQMGHPRTESGFPSTVTLPAAGTWLLIATAGKDWGCFELTVGD